MILYINGGSHAAAAEATNSFASANGDHRYQDLGRAPHPDNLKVAYGTVLAKLLDTAMHSDAESGSANARIIRSSKEWIEEKAGIVPPEDVFMVIQWTNWDQLMEESFAEIVTFHLYLKKLGFKHIFFNGNNTFYNIPEDDRYDFGESYINPYLPENSFDGWMQTYGHSPVITSNEYFGPDAHAAWARLLAQHITDNNMI